MRYVEAPELYTSAPGDGPSIFLAGGITGCEDWQHAACALLQSTPFVVFNPRRAQYDPGRGDSCAQQVAWEQRHLDRADVTLFWFPAGDPLVTVQPIALLELGFAMAEARRADKLLVVGVDHRYPRRADVELQLGGRLAGTPVHRTVGDTVAAACALAAECRVAPEIAGR